ncbi:MAG: metallophosphoesterase [Clostridia bacterium]|nr:metallophosphoesterase [Clostridia bacterium]
MWYIVLAFVWAISVANIIYVASRIRRFSRVMNLAKKHRISAWIVSLIPPLSLLLFAFINVFTLLIVTMHFLIAFILCDLVTLIIKKAAKKSFGYNIQNIVAILLAVIYLGAGWFFAHHVFVTEYTVYTDKDIGKDLRIVEIADLHLGITLDGEGFANQIKRVQNTNPDAVVIAGDFVDDDTKKQDMIIACRALGNLKTTYGVYFIFGNHDEGYFNSRSFTTEELRKALTDNGVTILEDESVLIDDRFYIVGRKDRIVKTRASADGLTKELDSSKFIIILDHQPNDYENEAKTKADIVLSGHTHGGHIFPAGLIGIITGANDRTYGTEVRNDTTFLVSSGISGWAIPFKTGAVSEFVVIDIKHSNNESGDRL